MDTKNKIPQIVHQLQEEYDSTQLFDILSCLSNTWKRKHPLWQYKLWNLQEVKMLIQEKYSNLIQLSANINNELLVNVARYFILFQEGGIFVDQDFECFEAFDKLIKNKSFCLFYEPLNLRNRTLSDSIIFSEKEHPFLRFIISNLKENIELIQEKQNLFINQMFHKYDDKDQISILSNYYVNPYTRDEIKLYNSRILTEEDMQDKLSEAYSICYYKRNRKIKKEVVSQISTDILYVSTSVGSVGGAFNAGYRIHLGLREIGLNSKMLVLNSGLSIDENQSNEIYISSREKNELCGYDSDMQPLYAYPNYSISTHGFSPAVVGVDLNRDIEKFDPKIVILHGINGGFATIENIAKIQRKVIWRLPDCWAITGGCYYYGNCKRYLTGCGKCPKLGSIDDNDLSHEIWKRKEESWKKIDMTVVVPTLWMKQVVENSTLLKDKNVYLIPNGLDLDLYYPIDKQTARKALRIPFDKKVILFGAINAFDPRKGFTYLLKALRLLSEKYRNEYYLIVFGANNTELGLKIPTKFLGYIRDQYILQLAYSAADIMIVSSLEEAFGQTVTEAMACGTPVIAFLETGPESIIKHKKTGYLARYADERDLAEGIKWVLSSRSIIDELSNNARNCMEQKYDIKIIAKQYEELFNTLLNK